MTGTNIFGRGRLNEQVDPDALLDSIGLDGEEIGWRKQHIDFDEDDEHRLSQLEPVFRDHAEEIADRFYANLTPHERTMDVFDRSDKGVEQLKRTQEAYLVTLATGDYDEAYFRDRARIGKLHEMLDMPLNFYIGQYGVYYNLLFELLDDRLQTQVVDAIREWTAEELADRDGRGVGERLLGALRDDDHDEEAAELSASLEATVRDEIHEGVVDLLSVLRALNLDMQVAVDTYVDAYSSKLEAAIERRERLAREVQQDVHSPLLDVNEAADEIARSAQHISAVADESSVGMQEMSEELASTSAATEEIASTASDVREQSQHARQKAEAGRRASERALSAMSSVEDAAEAAAEDVGALEDVFAQFDETLSTVEDVATRTRRLGREATLESTKVGGNREKFSELADEVKGFADETEAELDDVAEEVEAMRGAVAAAVESVNAAVEEIEDGASHVESSMGDLAEIADAVDATADGIEDVAEAADTQARSIEQLASLADQVASNAGDVATATGDIAAATQEQKAQVEQVAQNVGRLTEEET